MTQYSLEEEYILSPPPAIESGQTIITGECSRAGSAEVHGSCDLDPLLAFCLFIDGHLVVIWSQLGLRFLMQ